MRCDGIFAVDRVLVRVVDRGPRFSGAPRVGVLGGSCVAGPYTTVRARVRKTAVAKLGDHPATHPAHPLAIARNIPILASSVR